MIKDLTDGLVMLAVALLACFGFSKVGQLDGEATVQALWDIEAKQVAQEKVDMIARHAQEMATLRSVHDRNNLENAKQNDAALNKVRTALDAARAESRRLGGLRIPATQCPSGGREGQGAGTEATGTVPHHEGATSTIALPEPVETNLWSIVGEADTVTEQLRSCQNWIRTNGFYDAR